FMGVNFYSPTTVVAAGRQEEAAGAGWCVPRQEPDPVAERLGVVPVHHPQRERTQTGWEIDPEAFRQLLLRIHSDYGPLPLYVTENGAAFDDYVGPDGRPHDPDRIRYLHDHLEAVREAIDGGVDIRGYFVWSLLDNFEWAQGYSRRFGLVWVDYPSGERIPKSSFDWYRRTVAANAIAERP
ncbi:MAG TPA: family 1 glycosylhydrolase, partial [Acidimicrobiales bacterium]|nr:family 1 glycosylhydrolase [Acidimicrobiales bacterium]